MCCLLSRLNPCRPSWARHSTAISGLRSIKPQRSCVVYRWEGWGAKALSVGLHPKITLNFTFAPHPNQRQPQPFAPHLRRQYAFTSALRSAEVKRRAGPIRRYCPSMNRMPLLYRGCITLHHPLRTSCNRIRPRLLRVSCMVGEIVRMNTLNPSGKADVHRAT